ncbi:MAG: hypothetical protein MH204_12780, partial [Fimbriimonadaceae bacterium]|nr:hypothetical protein [Fimbriimonadaceae bacterium]
MTPIACLLAAAVGAQNSAPVQLRLVEEPGRKLVYRTALTYSVRLGPDAPVQPPAEKAGSRNSITYFSWTFIEHLRREADGTVVSDIRTWSEDYESDGWLANPANQPSGPDKGGGPARRRADGRWTLVPATTDFAPEIPLPVLPGRPVRIGDSW